MTDSDNKNGFLSGMIIFYYILIFIIVVGGLISFFNLPKDSGVLGFLIFIFSVMQISLLYNLIVLNQRSIDGGGNLISTNPFPTSTPNEESNQNVIGNDGLITKKKLYSNGNIEVLESYNNKNQKHGVWIYYLKNGSVDYKELYEDGNWVRNIR